MVIPFTAVKSAIKLLVLVINKPFSHVLIDLLTTVERKVIIHFQLYLKLFLIDLKMPPNTSAAVKSLINSLALVINNQFSYALDFERKVVCKILFSSEYFFSLTSFGWNIFFGHKYFSVMDIDQLY